MISRFTSLLRKPAKTEPIPAPESLIIEPDTPAKVTRLPNGRFHIQWQRSVETVNIYTHSIPAFDQNANIWATITGAQHVSVPPVPDITRPYFILEFAEDDYLIVAERFLLVPNSLNFRDIGGYQTKDGKFVRWGQVYRSGSLAKLNSADFAYFDALNLQMVCDLRSSHESETYPDRLPDNPQLQHYLRPLSDAGTRTERIKALRQYRHRTGELLLLLYQQSFIDENAHHIGDMLTRIADEANRPTLIHCSAGKDRTGVTTALLLTLLGVPEETIVADYSLSNHAYEQIAQIMTPDLRQARWVGVSFAKMKPVLLANPTILQETFAYIRSHYGTIEDYLCGKAGVAPKTIDSLRMQLLT
jgi:protein-tyrosine phosphatase